MNIRVGLEVFIFQDEKNYLSNNRVCQSANVSNVPEHCKKEIQHKLGSNALVGH